MKNGENNESRKVVETEEEKKVHWEPVARLNPLENMPVGVKNFHEQYLQTWNIKEHRKDDEYR